MEHEPIGSGAGGVSRVTVPPPMGPWKQEQAETESRTRLGKMKKKKREGAFFNKRPNHCPAA